MKKSFLWFDSLTTNGFFLIFSMLPLFALSKSKGERRLSRRPAGACSRLVQQAVLSLFILCAASLPLPANAELVDHIVSAVNHEVITSSDLQHAVALNIRLGTSGKDHKSLESETLEGLITRRLLVQEARRLRFVEVTDQEISDESLKLRQRFGSDKAFADFLSEQDMTEQELSRMLGEQLLVERFVEKKVGLFVRVGRELIQNYYDEHADTFKGKRLQDVQKNIYALLTQKRIDQQLDQYVAELRSKADIRTNVR
jgi:hypothetical protein